MFDETLERFAAAVHENPLLPKLEAMARELTGGTFFILWCVDDTVHRLCPDGQEADLHKFCRLTRSTPEGARRCSVCRSLVAVRACYHGLTDYCCHGGISVIAAPVAAPSPESPAFLVVSSCAFADADADRGWEAARKHAEGLPIAMNQLRNAYYELPALDETKARAIRHIVDVAACVLSDVYERVSQTAPSALPRAPRDAGGGQEVEDLLRPALAAAREGAVGRPDRPAGVSLTEMVMAIVGNNPAARYSVASVARAARMTPNHFSTLFHKHAGMPFTEFLVRERIALARTLLADPTMPVSEVALRVGFDDPSYFSRRFRQITGKAPNTYRRRYVGTSPE
ncbi:MAG: helix-turn-helix domain-containing protein [Candidatus Hydrogenedentes bacterium]|nr:helix-turn-helix domain-containing protein [Candidatus Hydrogenedentota bacterium]